MKPKIAKPKIIKDKDFLRVLQHIEDKIDTTGTGALISVLADSLDELTKDGHDVNIRSIEIIYNDFFSHKQTFSEE